MKKSKLHITISEADKHWLDAEALVNGMSFSDLVRRAIRSYRLSELAAKAIGPNEDAISWIKRLGI